METASWQWQLIPLGDIQMLCFSFFVMFMKTIKLLTFYRFRSTLTASSQNPNNKNEQTFFSFHLFCTSIRLDEELQQYLVYNDEIDVTTTKNL